MPPRAAKPSPAVLLVFGEDEFAVKQRAKQLYQQWAEELGGMDHEIIDATVSNSGEALKALARLREALQTLPFFGSAKVIWLKDCNFFGDERTATSQAVTETLAELARELKEFSWQDVRLLISAGKVDKRKVFYKAIEKIGAAESFAGWSIDDKDWADQAEAWARKAIKARQKDIAEDALAELISRVGPNARQLDNEIEKLALYVGGRANIELADVNAICTRNKLARAFALGDALGERDLPRLLRRLDEDLWEVKLDPQKSEIGLLYGLISKIRAMILAKELAREGYLKPEPEFFRFKTQWERIPTDSLPQDKRFNPLALNPYVLFRAAQHARNYTAEELIRAMDLLLRCNRQLVTSGLDEALVIQQTLVQIVERAAERGPPPAAVAA
jgi:DNA polymerase-3 subunit delta